MEAVVDYLIISESKLNEKKLQFETKINKASAKLLSISNLFINSETHNIVLINQLE